MQSSDPALAARIGEALALRREADPKKRFEIYKASLDGNNVKLSEADKNVRLFVFAARVGLPEEELRYAEAARQADPNHPTVIEWCYRRSAARKDWKDAEEWVARSKDANSDGMGGRLFVADLIIQKHRAGVPSDMPLAIEILREAVEARPDDKRLKVQLADCHLLLKEYDKAQALFEAILRLDASYFDAIKGMALVTARDKPAEHDAWVEKAARMPQGRTDPYIQQESANLLEGRADPNALAGLIQKRLALFEGSQAKSQPTDLENLYRLGTLLERAIAAESNEWVRDEHARMAKRVYSVLYLSSPPEHRLAAARPLADFLGRTNQLNDLFSLLADLGEQPGVNKLDRQVLAGDALSYADPASAEAAYKKALEIDPKDAKGYAALAAFYERMGNWTKASENYRQAMDLSTSKEEKSRAWRLWAQATFLAGDANAAANTLREYLATDPSNPDGLALLGLVALSQKRYDDAQTALDKALNSDPTHTWALLRRAELNIEQGRPDKAREDLEAVRLGPSDTSAAMRCGQLRERLGDMTDAELAYRNVLARQRNHEPAMRALIQLYLSQQKWGAMEARLAEARQVFRKNPFFLRMEAQMWKARSQPQKALAALREALEAAPDSVQARSDYLLSLLEEHRYAEVLPLCDEFAATPSMRIAAMAAKGRALVRLGGREAEAADCFREALRSNPAMPQVMFTAQQAALAYSSPAAASQWASRWARENNLSGPRVKAFLGQLYFLARDFASATRFLAEAKAEAKEANLDPADQNAITSLLGTAYYQDKKYSQAEQAYLEALQTSPDDLQVLNNLACLYAEELNDANKAVPYAKKALRLAPGNPNVLDTYGWALAKAGKYSEAADVLRQVVATNGANPIFRYHLGWAYEQDGRKTEALQQYQEGLKLPPSEDDTSRSEMQKGADRLRTKS